MNNKRFLTSIVCFTVMAVQAFAQSTTSMAEKDNDNIPQYSYSVEEMDKVSEYIKQQYGEFDIVAHELISTATSPSFRLPMTSLITNWSLWGRGPSR